MTSRMCFPKIFWLIVALLPALLSGCTSLAGSNPLGSGTSWKEEVLLHDGRTMVAKRSQSYGGRHEIGQTPPIKEQNITFTVPGTSKAITWTSEYSEDIGRSNFDLLALHILNDTPYLVASPNLCLSYNKWGRPNPPYVLFKYDGSQWVRIALSALPSEFKELNLVVNTKSHAEKLSLFEPASPEKIKKLNSSLRQPEFQNILREPLDKTEISCTEMIRVNDGWVSIDWFTSQPSYEQCLRVCNIKAMNTDQCPCGRLFKRNKKENQAP